MIRIWYGGIQTFGSPGLPQKWVNVLGCVENAAGPVSLRGRIGRGPWFPVALGPDGRRLAAAGDFNAEIDAGELRRVLSLFQATICETTLSLEARDLPRLPAEPGSRPGLPTSGVPTAAREHLTAHWATSIADGD